MELLAHASAPSSRKDDERFKRQAVAYSTFQPAAKTPIHCEVNVAPSGLGNRTDNVVHDVSLKTPARLPRIDPEVYLDDTQLAISALDSQLLTSSLRLDEDDAGEEDDEEGDDGSVPWPVVPKAVGDVSSGLPPDSSDWDGSPLRSTGLHRGSPTDADPPIKDWSDPLPPDSSNLEASSTRRTVAGNMPLSRLSFKAKDVSRALPPIRSSGTNGSLSKDIALRKRQRTSEPVSSRSYGQGNLLSSPLVPLQDDEGTGIGYIGGLSTAQIWATPSGPLPDGGPTIAQPDPPEPSVSSPGDDVPSQLPSTYSLSDLSSDNHSHREVVERVMSSPWGSLPRGTMSEADADSNAHETPKENHHFVGTPSTRRHRANVSVLVRPLSDQQTTSSVSLDGGLHPRTEQPQAEVGEVLIVSSPQLHGTKAQTDFKDQTRSSPGPAASSSNNISALLATNKLATSSPAFESGANRVVEVTRRLVVSKPLPRSSSPIPAIELQPENGTSSAMVPGSSTPMPASSLGCQSVLSPMVPETLFATRKRKFAAFSTPKTRPRPEELETLRSLPIELAPGPPATSTKRFETHITGYLQKTYFENPELENRYHPIHVTREIRRLERGHWLIDPSSWTLSAQIKFWNYLRHQVTTERAGWGVWCMRGSDDTGSQDMSEQDLGLVRMFCWGEVVAHVYLLLYVASGCKVRNVEPCWIDADGEVVVRI